MLRSTLNDDIMRFDDENENEFTNGSERLSKDEFVQNRLGATDTNNKQKKRKRENVEAMSFDVSKYSKGSSIPTSSKHVPDKKLRRELSLSEKSLKNAAIASAKAEILNTESVGFLEAEGMEKTYKFKQVDIAKAVDIQTARKIHDISLPSYGPYSIDYLRSGRFILLGGRKGHLAMIDSLRYNVVSEFNVKQSIHDVKFLHNETMVAVAQKKYVHIYDKSGMEIHCLRDHLEPLKLEFLPYHFLLASIGRTGFLKYQDTSTGKLVAEHRTKLGPCEVMQTNSYNGVIHLGHANGTVTLWSPNQNEALVKMMCHRGPVRSLAVEKDGNYMVTSGMDGQMKVWDIRKFQPVHQYYTNKPASSLNISQMGMLAVGFGAHVQIWKDALKTKAISPYMTHLLPGCEVNDMLFRPFDDVLTIGHSKGLTSMVVPGSGEPNLDTREANPYQTLKQRRETDVIDLLEKLQPEMISLNPEIIGTVDKASKEVIEKERMLSLESNSGNKKDEKIKKKMRGKNKPTARMRRNQANIMTKEKKMIREEKKKSKEDAEKGKGVVGNRGKEKPRDALSRFG